MSKQNSKRRAGYCDGITRRNVMRVGAAGLFAGAFLGSVNRAFANEASPSAKAKSCIFFMLEGGPSHIDLWDLKPQAPAEIRGPFLPIATSVPGTQISQLLPRCAQIVDRFTILRSHSHADNAHQTGRHWVLTGYPPNFADGQAQGMPFNVLYPSIGSIVARELGSAGDLPPMSNCPIRWDREGRAFTGRSMPPSRLTTTRPSPTSRFRISMSPVRSRSTGFRGGNRCWTSFSSLVRVATRPVRR
jgi:hypothetical protein